MSQRDFHPPYNQLRRSQAPSGDFHLDHRGRSLPGRAAIPVPVSLVLIVYLVLATLVSTTTVRILHGRSDPVALAGPNTIAFANGPPKYLVLMVLDGGRPDYFGVTKLPHVDALRAQGTQFSNAMLGILEAETPAGHATIATGSTPVRDGILGFDWAQNDNDFSLFSPEVVNAGAFDKIMESVHAPTIAGLYKAMYPGSKVVALSGHKYYAAAPLGGPAADAIMYFQGDATGRYVPAAVPGHIPPPGVLDAPGLTLPTIHPADGQDDGSATKLALAAFAKIHQRITLINYPEFDWPLGHVYGSISNRAKVGAEMVALDRDLGKIEDAYRKAGILDQTLFVITADHGMDLTHGFVPQTLITNAVTAAGTTAPAVSYSTAGYVWLTDQTKAQTVGEHIAVANDPGVQSVYYLAETNGKPGYVRAKGTLVNAASEAANQYLLDTLLNGHQPTVAVFAREGMTFADPKTNWKADHGGNGWQSQHLPIIMAGPGIRAGVVSNAPAQLDDLAPTLLTDMGVAPTGMQGRALTEALSAPSASDERSRSIEIAQMKPLMAALMAQGRAEIAIAAQRATALSRASPMATAGSSPSPTAGATPVVTAGATPTLTAGTSPTPIVRTSPTLTAGASPTALPGT